MTNPDNVGGLPDLVAVGEFVGYGRVTGEPHVRMSPGLRPGVRLFTEDQMREAIELCRATPADNAGGLIWYVCTSCMLMVRLPSDTPTLGRCQCSPKGWSLRRAKLPKGYELCRAAPAGGDGLRLLVKELRESLEGVVRVADRQTDEFDRAREAIARAAHVFVNAGDSEAQFIADGENLDCPACGGSGHAGDSAPAGSGEVEDVLKKCDSVLNDIRPISPCLTEQLERYFAEIRALLRKLQQGADGWRREGDCLKRVKAKLLTAGATLPAPENKGNAESAIKMGLSIALLLVETELNEMADEPASQDQEGGKP